MKIFLNVLLLFFIFTSLNAQEQKKIVLQLHWLHQFQFAGYYMAKEMGYYKDAGLDVEIREVKNDTDFTQLIEDGELDFAIGRASLLIDRYNGKDVVALAAIYQESPLILLVTKESKIESIQDLKGRKVMLTTDAIASTPIIAMLNSNGVRLEDVILQKHTYDLEDLVSGVTDAMGSYTSNEPIRLEDRNIDYKIFYPKNYGYEFYDDILYTSSKYIEANPEVTKKFYEASMKGWHYAFENIVKTAEVIHEKYNTQNKTKAQLIKEGESLKKLAYCGEFHQIGCLDKEILQKILDIYKILGFITADVDLDTFVYEHNKPDMFRVKLTNRDAILFVSFAILIFVGVLFLIVFTSIKNKWLVSYKQLEEEVKSSKEALENQKNKIKEQYKTLDLIVNKSNKIILFKDENLNYRECNQYFATLVGKEITDIIGKNDFYLFDEELAREITAICQEVIRSRVEQIRTDVLKFPTSDAKRVYRFDMQPFEYEVGRVGLIIFGSDITQES